MQCQTKLFAQVGLLVALGTAAVCSTSPVDAQIVPDATLGQASSQVRSNATVQGRSATLVEGGATRGAHLFHSFSDFNVGNRQRVYFANPAGVLNIFSRVTGNSGSNILGTLGVDGMANLYLLNPNGIVFGPNARLDIAGSFVASTANRLVFDDGQFFSTVAPNQPPLLQINVTPGLQYGNNFSATIRNQGNLQVGQNLTLGAQRLELAGALEAGRDITLQGWSRQLSAANYTVGGYLFTQSLRGQGIDLLIPHENVILANGDVRFTQNYVGESLHVLAGGQVSRAAGANNITTTGTSGGSVTEQIATGTGGLQTVTVTASDQPTVDIRSGVDWSQLTGELPGNSNTSEAAVTFGVRTGEGIALRNITNNGGDIALWAAGDVTVNDLDTSFSASSVDAIQVEDGGAIIVWAEGNIEANILASYSHAESEGDNLTGKNGGMIFLTAGNNITASNINSNSTTRSETSQPSDFDLNPGDVIGGNGGAVILIADNDIVLSSIDSSSYSSSFPYSDTPSPFNLYSGDVRGGNGGNIQATAGRDITLDSINSRSISYSSSSSNGFLYSYFRSGNIVGGNGGNVWLSAEHNIALDSISSNTFSSSSSILFDDLSSKSLPSGNVVGGNSGNIWLTADNDIVVELLVSDSLASSSAAGYSSLDISSGDINSGNSGIIWLVAGRDIILDSVFSNSLSNSRSDLIAGDIIGGNGGNVRLEADRDIRLNSINSYSYSNSVTSPNLTSPYSSFDTTLRSGNVIGGNGGNIWLMAGKTIILELLDSSSSSVSSSYQNTNLYSGNITGGNGGDIQFTANQNVTLYIANSSSISISDAVLASGSVAGGNGGEIKGSSNYSITLNSISSSSVSISDEAPSTEEIIGGDGGNIFLTAELGSISGSTQNNFFFDNVRAPSIRSFSATEGGLSGNGGVVVLEAATQINSGNPDYLLEILTLSASAQSGAVQITGLGENLAILNTSVIASKTVEINNPFTGETIPVTVGEAGQSGNIDISGNGNITFTNSSFLSDTNGSDPAGDVTIRTPGSVTFNNSSINTNTQSSGTAGSIDIQAESITLDPFSEITAVTRSSEQAGNIRLRPYGNGRTLSINLNGEDSLISSSSLLPDDADTTFNGTEVTGQGGSIFISAPAAVTIQGEGDLKVETETSGNAGRLEINAPQIIIDSVEVSASSKLPDLLTDGLSEDAISQVRASYQSRQGGSIEINTRELILRDRAEITADTSTLGRGGNLVVQNIGGPLTIRGDGELTVSASGANSGRAGTLEINASELLSLLDGIELTASSESINGGGEIDITVDGSLFMAGDSVINASASNPNAGDGGNITINLIDGLLIAPPGQNNDIIANAAGGNGGKITITALGIYGFTLQDISDVEVLRSNSTNDISASSNTGVDGEITLNTFELDLSQLSELPANLLDASGLAEQSLCQAGVGSEFVVTGRGGLPSTPIDALSSTATWEDWSIDSSSAEITSTLNDQALGTGAIAPLAPSAPATDQPIIEAQGWTRTADGRVALVVDPATVNPDSDQLTVQDCRQLRQVVSSETSSPQPETLATAAGTSDNP